MKKCALAVLFALFGAVPSAFASLIGVDWSSTGAASNLYSINTATGVATTIGSTGVPRLIGLVVDVDSSIYVISEEANSRLWKLNSTSGAATLIGSLGFNLQEGDMTIDPLSGQMYVSDGAGDRLYTVNRTTGAATLIGQYGAAGRDVSGLQFIGSALYGLALRDGAADALVTVNPLTGVATSVGSTGTNFGIISALGRDPADGKIYVAGPATGFGNDNQLYTLNLATGMATLVGPLTGVAASISGFSVAGDPVILTPGVPEPGLMVLLGISVAAGARRMRRRRP